MAGVGEEMKRLVHIVDYHMGNLRSVSRAFEFLGCDVTVSDKVEDIRNAQAIVLPGVGAFGNGMENLRNLGLIDPMKEEALKMKKPFLGICLGMQLLATSGTENGMHLGLDWIPGVVDRIRSDNPMIRVPHMGWDDIAVVSAQGMYKGLKATEVFYFVHSYVLCPQDVSVINGACDYGVRFAASIESGNIWGTQYHPEKSQKAGLKVLQNFLDSVA